MAKEKAPGREQMTIRLPSDLKEALQREAERKGFTLHDLMMFIFLEALRCKFPK